MSRSGVLRHVVQRLLDNSIQMRLDALAHPNVFQAGTAQLRDDVERLRPFGDELTDSGDGPQIESDRPQLSRHEIQLPVELVGNRSRLRDTSLKDIVRRYPGKSIELKTQR